LLQLASSQTDYNLINASKVNTKFDDLFFLIYGKTQSNLWKSGGGILTRLPTRSKSRCLFSPG
jgi:hypothetical protein